MLSCLIKHLMNVGLVHAQNELYSGATPSPMVNQTVSTPEPLYKRTTPFPHQERGTPSPRPKSTPTPWGSTTSTPRGNVNQHQQINEKNHFHQHQFTTTTGTPIGLSTIMPSAIPYDGFTPPYMGYNPLGLWPWAPYLPPPAPWFMNPTPHYRNYNRGDFLSPYSLVRGGYMNSGDRSHDHSPGIDNGGDLNEIIQGQSLNYNKSKSNGTSNSPYSVGSSHHFSSVSSSHGHWDPLRGMVVYDKPEVCNELVCKY